MNRIKRIFHSKWYLTYIIITFIFRIISITGSSTIYALFNGIEKTIMIFLLFVGSMVSLYIFDVVNYEETGEKKGRYGRTILAFLAFLTFKFIYSIFVVETIIRLYLVVLN